MTSARHFGEEGGRLSYGSYLHIDELLAQQVPESAPPAHDELLFITIHQVYELWFKLLLHELTTVRACFSAVVPRLRRCGQRGICSAGSSRSSRC